MLHISTQHMGKWEGKRKVIFHPEISVQYLYVTQNEKPSLFISDLHSDVVT